MPRFLLSEHNENDGAIRGEESHHIAKVHRYKVGDALDVIGSARIFSATITEITPDAVFVKLNKELPSVEPGLEVTLYQGLLKGEKQELIIQKAVELGVKRIVPVVCTRSIVNLDAKKAMERTTRWQRIAQEASKQSGRASVPIVDKPVPLSYALHSDSAELKLMAYEGSRTSLKSILQSSINVRTVSLLIGPEGGFDTREVALAKEANYSIVSLGPRILRAETAPLALLSIVMYELGDMGGL